jgi:hypothetical protein
MVCKATTVPRGTFRSILRQSGLDESVFGRSQISPNGRQRGIDISQ